MSHVRNEVRPSGSGGTGTQAASQQLLVPSTGPEDWGENGKLVAVPYPAPITLHIGWVRGDSRHATA